MIIENIQYEIDKHQDKSDVIKIWYIKEYLQIHILKKIYEFDYAKNLIFYGWTSLRFLFNLNRLSEDLDFIGNDFSDFETLGKDIQNYFWKQDIYVDYKIQKFRITYNFKNFLQHFGMQYGKSNDLYIKIEISDHFDFCKKFDTKIYPIFKYNESLLIKSLDKSTLFSTKLGAVLYRNWKKQMWDTKITVKWRDIYDLFWYLSTNTIPNLDCIEGLQSLPELKEKLKKIIENIDFKEVVIDVENFIEDDRLLDFIENGGKSYILEKIEEL